MHLVFLDPVSPYPKFFQRNRETGMIGWWRSEMTLHLLPFLRFHRARAPLKFVVHVLRHKLPDKLNKSGAGDYYVVPHSLEPIRPFYRVLRKFHFSELSSFQGGTLFLVPEAELYN